MLLLSGTIWMSTAQLEEGLELGDLGWTAFGGSDAHTGHKRDLFGPPVGLLMKWAVNVKGSLSYPVVYDNKVFVMTHLGLLHCYEDRSGIIKGMFFLGEEAADIGPPTIGHDHKLYVQYIGVSGGTHVFVVNIRHEILMFVERVALGDSRLATYPYGVASSEFTDLLYFAGGEYGNMLYGVNRTSGIGEFGAELYSTFYGCDDWAPTVNKEGRVFFAAGAGDGNPGYIGEVEHLTGDVLWSYPLSTTLTDYSTHWVPVEADGIILAIEFASSTKVSLSAIFVDSQKLLWHTDVCDVLEGRDVTPAMDDLHVYLTCSDGVRSFHKFTGLPGLIQYAPCVDECFGQPIVTLDALFVQSLTGTKVYDKLTGELVAETADGEGKMAYFRGSLYVAVEETLFAYDVIHLTAANPFEE